MHFCFIVSPRVSAPLWYIVLALFYLGPPQKKLNLSDPPFMRISPRNFGEPDSSPWNIPSSKKAKTHFLKKQKILFQTMKWEHIWTLKYEYTVAKSKNRRWVRLLSILFLLSSYWDLKSIFNVDSRKNALKFSGLRWFLLFEDLYNGEGSLQENKTSKKHNLNSNQEGNKGTSKLQPIF